MFQSVTIQTMKNKLKDLRRNANLTQQDLADKIGISRTQIAKWESGMQNPSLEWLSKIAKALKKPLSSLIENNSHLENSDDFREILALCYEVWLEEKLTQDVSPRTIIEIAEAIQNQLTNKDSQTKTDIIKSALTAASLHA